MNRRGRVTASLVAVTILVAGVGLAVLDSQRHRAAVRAEALERVQTEADLLAGALTQISRESRTLAAASREDGFTVAVEDVRARNDAVLGALVLEDWTLHRVTVPALPPALLQAAGIVEGTKLEIDEALPDLAVPLRSVLEDGGLLLAGPFPVGALPVSLTLIADRAPAVEGVVDSRLLLVLLDIGEVLALAQPAGTGQPLETAVLLDGGVEGIEDFAPRVVRGDEGVFADGARATADVAGVSVQVAGRPVGGWPAASPAAPLILLPTVLGAALGWLMIERRRTEQGRLQDRVERATAELRLARARERATIEHSPDGLLGLHGDVVESANPAAAALLGVPPAQLVGRRLADLLDHDAAFGIDGTEVHHDGRVLLVRSSPVPAGVDDDADRHVVGLHDVSAERRSAQLLRRYTRKLEQVNAQYDELESVRNDLVAKVSHEIRTPLTVIGGVADLLQRDGVDARQRDDLLEAFQRQLGRLREQVEGLLDLAESSRPVAAIATTTDVAEVAEEVAASLGLDCPVAGQGTAHVAPDALRRVLRAVLSNAASYGHPPVRVAVGVDGDTAWCEVRDPGPGVPASTDPFVPFAQGDSGDRRTSRGLGVGLAMARGLARAAGGDLVLVSRRDPTTFRLTLPREARETVVPEGSLAG